METPADETIETGETRRNATSRPTKRRPHWCSPLMPDWHADSLLDVTAKRLKKLEIEGVMLDLDGTLTQWSSAVVSPEVIQWMNEINDAGIRSCVVSNTHRVRRLKEICTVLNVDYVLGVAKPWPRGFRIALKKLGTDLEKTAIIGDQIFTDILGGNRFGLYTILVPALSTQEFFMTRWVSRNLEKALFSYLRRTDRLPPREP